MFPFDDVIMKVCHSNSRENFKNSHHITAKYLVLQTLTPFKYVSRYFESQYNACWCYWSACMTHSIMHDDASQYLSCFEISRNIHKRRPIDKMSPILVQIRLIISFNVIIFMTIYSWMLWLCVYCIMFNTNKVKTQSHWSPILKFELTKHCISNACYKCFWENWSCYIEIITAMSH